MRLAARPHWDVGDVAALLRDGTTRLDQLRIGDLDVRATLMLAYLDSPEPVQRAFRSLSVLPAAEFPLWAVAAVLDVDARRAADVVDGLVDAQLLEAAGTGRAARFHYQALLSVLARELSATHDDPSVARESAERVAVTYLELCQHADHLLSPGRSFWLPPGPAGSAAAIVGDDPLRWFARERAALIDIMRALYRSEQWRAAWQLAESLGSYLEAIAAWNDWEVTQQLALEAAVRLDDPIPTTASLNSLGDLAWQRRRYAEAETRYQEAADLADRSGLSQSHSRALVGLADLHLANGDHARARSLARRAVSVSSADADIWGCCNALRSLALGQLDDNRPDHAIRSFMECAALAGQVRHHRFEGFALASAQRIATLGNLTTSEGLEIQPGLWRLPALA
ncbi:tetratricopeptide repeat protein [Micromonospora sp. M12]